MKRISTLTFALFLALSIGVLKCSAQTYPVPTLILDSLIFEVQKGRKCSRVLEAKNIALQKAGNEILIADSLIEVKNKILSYNEFIIKTWETDYAATVKRLRLEKKLESRKRKKVTLIAIVEGVLIILLVI